MKCTHCRTEDQHRIIIGPRNIAAIVFNTIWFTFQFALLIVATWAFEYEGVGLKRKCYKCGYRFIGPWKEPPNFLECARCGYNLTGNVSGRCPECGWKLTRRHRAFLKKMSDPVQSSPTDS